MIVEVWADYVCPWCYLALDRADHLRRRHGLDVVWHPFELHPEVPPEGVEAPTGVFSDDVRSELREALRAADLPVTRRSTVSNSARALALSAWAKDRGPWEMLHRNLFTAYWSDGRDLGDAAVLVDVATGSGYDRAEVEEAIAAGFGTNEVIAARERALDLGIGGTPGWHFGDGVVLVGAHPAHVLDRVVARQNPLPAEGSDR